MKKAIVLGETSGIGMHGALLLASDGYRVDITGRRTELLECMRARMPQNLVCAPDAISRLGELISELGGLDLFVFSSGTGT